MRAAVSVLLALFVSLGAMQVPFGACKLASASCARRPCCKPAPQNMPAIRAKMACCDVAHAVESRLAPAVSREQAQVMLVAGPGTTTLRIPVPTRRDPDITPPSPRGSPLYLRNRSLLL